MVERPLCEKGLHDILRFFRDLARARVVDEWGERRELKSAAPSNCRALGKIN